MFNANTQAAPAAKKVERIYITKGDNATNDEGVKCDKMVGFVIDGMIHWMDYEFAYLRELGYCTAAVNVHLSECGSWGEIDEDGSANLSNKVTKINHHHDDLWLDKYSYKKRTKLNAAGKTYWSWGEIKDTYFNIETQEAQVTDMQTTKSNPKAILKATPDATTGLGQWNKWEQEAQERIKARTKVVAENNPIERIYFTRGDREYDELGRKVDKRAALVINGKIYWLKPRFTHLWELSNALECLGVSVSDVGDWGFWEGNRAPLRNTVTAITKTHKEIFADDSKYSVEAERIKGTTLWWSVKAIKTQIFDPIEANQPEPENLDDYQPTWRTS